MKSSAAVLICLLFACGGTPIVTFDAGVGGGAGGGSAGGTGGGAGGGAGGGSGGGTGGGTGGGVAGPKTVFITKSDFTGNLGGLAGADGLCTTAATTAGRTGTWKAYVSSDTVSAPSRITDVGPWVQRYADGGTPPTFANKAAFNNGPAVGLKVDETGATLATVDSWTGSLPDGTPDVGVTCTGFTSALATLNADVGTSGTTNTDWQHNGGTTCDKRRHLICFEQ